VFQVSSPSFPSSIVSPLSKNSLGGLRGGFTGAATVGGPPTLVVDPPLIEQGILFEVDEDDIIKTFMSLEKRRIK